MLASAALTRISQGSKIGRRTSAGSRQSRPGTVKSDKESSRPLATHTETEVEPELADEEYISPIPQAGYTSRHVLSIFPPMPVLDKLQELQAKLSASTRIVPVPRPNMQIVLLPLGTSLDDPGKLREAKLIMDKVAKQTNPITIEVGALGCIPKWSKPREVFASLGAGRETLKSLIKVLEDEFKSADFRLNEPGAVKHRTKIPLGLWEDVYVTNLQGDLAKEVADQVGTYTQASFMANQMVLLEQRPDASLVPVHVSLLGTTLPSKKRARYKTLL